MQPKIPISFSATLLPKKFVGMALNDRGEIVGQFDVNKAAHWHRGRLTKLPGVVDEEHKAYNKSGLSWNNTAASIANSGLISGSAGWLLDGDFECRPTIWKKKKPFVLPMLNWPLDHFEVQGINLRGEAVGIAQASGRMGGNEWLGKHENEPEAVAAGLARALYWSGGKLKDLGWGTLQAINDAGDFVGQSGKFAALWHRGRKIKLAVGTANAISPSGIVVGDRGDDQRNVAFRWEEGKLASLRPLPRSLISRARGVNDAGRAVGISGNFASSEEGVATLWVETTPYDLNVLTLPPRRDLSAAVAINASGQILCRGDDRSVLLTPRR